MKYILISLIFIELNSNLFKIKFKNGKIEKNGIMDLNAAEGDDI